MEGVSRNTGPIDFDIHLYYKDGRSTVASRQRLSVSEALVIAVDLAAEYVAEFFVIYDPRGDSNEHFPGSCYKTFHDYGMQIHRTLRDAERWMTGRMELGLK